MDAKSCQVQNHVKPFRPKITQTAGKCLSRQRLLDDDALYLLLHTRKATVKQIPCADLVGLDIKVRTEPLHIGIRCDELLCLILPGLHDLWGGTGVSVVEGRWCCAGVWRGNQVEGIVQQTVFVSCAATSDLTWSSGSTLRAPHGG